MKIIIVMTFFQRQYQLDVTLHSIVKTAHKDLEIVIVDDCSAMAPLTGMSDIPITVLRTENKQWIDGSPAYNIGIDYALRHGADIIILQNAETYHVGDVVEYASRITDKDYISFACYNLSREFTFRPHDISWLVANRGGHAVDNEKDAWLNHGTIRRMGYHWCSAITAKNMYRLNGFDERMSEGYCFEDDELLARVNMLKLNIEITEHPFVVHQWHDRGYVPGNWQELFKLNQSVCELIRQEQKPFAIHKFTPDFNV